MLKHDATSFEIWKAMLMELVIPRGQSSPSQFLIFGFEFEPFYFLGNNLKYLPHFPMFWKAATKKLLMQEREEIKS